jgi:elongation factor P
MNQDTFDQIPVPNTIFGEAIQFLKEGMILKIRFDDNEKPLAGDLPKHVELETIYTEMGVKGKLLKVAQVEGNINVQVPLFVEVGDKLKINTETGDYVERIMK